MRPAASKPQGPLALFVDFVGSRIGAAVFSFGTIWLVTHHVPVPVAGVYIAALSYALLLSGFLDLGTGPGLVREAARGDVERHITVYVWTRAALTIAVMVVGAAGLWLAFPPDARAAGALGLGIIASSVYGVVGPIGQVLGSARTYRNLTLLQGAGTFAGVLAAVALAHHPSATLLVGAYAAGSMVPALAAWPAVRPHIIAMPVGVAAREVRANVHALTRLGLATGAASIYLRVDQSIVLRSLGSTPSAYYGLASRINMQARVLPATVQLSIAGLLARDLQSTDGIPAARTRVLAALAVGIGLGSALLIVATADLALLVLGGPEYSAALRVTLILGVAMVAASFNYVVATAAIMGSRDRLYLAATLGAAAFNIGANLVLTPRLGLTAAAATALATELLAVIYVSVRLGPRAGALSPVAVLACTAVAGAAAMLKDAAVSAGAAVNVPVSVLLALVATACFLVALKNLKALNAVAAPPAAATV